MLRINPDEGFENLDLISDLSVVLFHRLLLFGVPACIPPAVSRDILIIIGYSKARYLVLTV